MIKDQPKTDASLVDFLNTAIRASGPNEVANPKYIVFTRFLLKSKTPEFLFRNKALLNGAMRGKSVLKMTKPTVSKTKKSKSVADI